MDHLMSGKFTGEAPISACIIFFGVLLSHFEVFTKCMFSTDTFNCYCAVHLVAVMVFHEFIIRVGKVTTMLWYVLFTLMCTF